MGYINDKVAIATGIVQEIVAGDGAATAYKQNAVVDEEWIQIVRLTIQNYARFLF